MSNVNIMRPAATAKKVTPGSSDLPDGPCVALCVGTAGAATMISAAGDVLTNFPLQQGYNPIQIRQVTSASASDIWALYNP